MTSMKALASNARAAQSGLAAAASARRAKALRFMAQEVRKSARRILAANREDLAQARVKGVSEAFLDRLRLDGRRLEEAVSAVKKFSRREEWLGETMESWRTSAGLRVRKVRVPLGVALVVFEARPLVCLEAAMLALKSGNALMLRPSRDAKRSCRALIACVRSALRRAGLSADCVTFVPPEGGKWQLRGLLALHGLVDVVIPRGGERFIRWVRAHARVPVLETGAGNCHVYVDASVDASADFGEALAILVNAKTSRPSVCNAAEKLLVHKGVAKKFLPLAVEALRERGVRVHGCPRSRKIVKGLLQATEADWFKEYLGLEIAVKVVGSLDEAIAHVNKYSSRHSEAIVARDKKAIRRFLDGVDSAVVYSNASTRFSDGGCFGFGGEVGISTQKLHARGPLGGRELTSYKYLVEGKGQVRA